MCAPAQARRRACIHSDRPLLPVGACALPAAWALGESENTVRPQCGTRRHEQSHHLDALLWSARVLSSVQGALHARTLSRTVRIRAASIFDVDARETSSLARPAVAPRPACMRISCDPRVG